MWPPDRGPGCNAAHEAPPCCCGGIAAMHAHACCSSHDNTRLQLELHSRHDWHSSMPSGSTLAHHKPNDQCHKINAEVKATLPGEAQVLRSTGRSIQIAQAAVQAPRKCDCRAMAGHCHLPACTLQPLASTLTEHHSRAGAYARHSGVNPSLGTRRNHEPSQLARQACSAKVTPTPSEDPVAIAAWPDPSSPEGDQATARPQPRPGATSQSRSPKREPASAAWPPPSTAPSTPA